MKAKSRIATTVLMFSACGLGVALAQPSSSEAAAQDTTGSQRTAVEPGFPAGAGLDSASSEVVDAALKQAATAHGIYKALVYQTVWAAVEANDVYDVENHLVRGVNINAPRPDGATLLHQAARAGNIYMIDHLLARGADINAIQGQNLTPVIAAVDAGQREAVRFLCERGASYAVEQAIEHGDKESVGVFLDRNPNMIEEPLPDFGYAMVLTSEGRGVSGEEPDLRERTKTLLLVAVQSDRIDMVQFLLARGASFVRDRSAVDSLFYAAMHGYEAMVRLIVADGMDPDAQTDSGETALYKLAAKGGPATMIDLLVELGASVNVPTEGGVTPLLMAAKRGDLPAVEALLKYGARVDRMDNAFRTSLSYVAEKGYTDVAKSLIAHGASLSSRDRKGRTPLHMAAAGNRLKTLEALVESGADVMAQDAAGWTPLHYAAQVGNCDMAALLVSKGATVEQPSGPNFTALHAAAQAGKDSVLEYFLSLGVFVDLLDRDRRAPLYYALESKSLPAVRLLVDHGADVNAVDAHGETPLFPAVQTLDDVVLLNSKGKNLSQSEDPLPGIPGPEKLATLLLTRGANVKVKDNQGRMPLHAAAELRCFQTARLLVENGAETDPRDANGATPLYWAAQDPDPRLFDLLIPLGADIHIVDNAGQTLLHVAAAQGAASTVRYLISQGLDMNVLDNSGMAPIHHAANNGQYEAVQALTKAGADVHLQATNGQTALRLAKDSRDRVVKEVGEFAGLGAVTAKHQRTFKVLRSLIAISLNTAAVGENVEELRRLVGLYPDFLEEEIGHLTPLARAIGANNMPAVELLISAGAQPLGLGRTKKTAYGLAMEKGSIEIAGLLKPYQDVVAAKQPCPVEVRADIGKKIVEQYRARGPGAEGR